MRRFKGKKATSLSIVLLLMFVLLVGGCAQETTDPDEEQESPAKDSPAVVEDKEMILATTTSTQDSGLLDVIIPDFTEETGIEVKVVAVGTGNAIAMGENGEADVLLVHAKAAEEEFIVAGHGVERFDVMYNDFVIIGPEEDPANVGENPADVVAALTSIMETESTFVSRGDNSGTNKKELQLWEIANLEPSGDWYLESGQGMGDTIQIAEEKLGYTMTDRATYLSMMEELDLQVVVKGDESLFNQYGVIAVNPNKNDQIKAEGAQAFIEWLLSADTQALIGEFGKDAYGQNLFTPNAQ